MNNKVSLKQRISAVWTHRSQYLAVASGMLTGHIRFAEAVFTVIQEQKLWGSEESLSGPGSSVNSTRKITRALESVVHEFKIRSILDIPCGDFHWMARVKLNEVDYVGADIVETLVDRNNDIYYNKSREFRKLDICRDRLPEVDLVFTRDLFLHFNNSMILKSIENVVRSGSRFWMVSTALSEEANRDSMVGFTRPVNLCREPFSLPPPTDYFQDGEPGNLKRNMAIWTISDILADRESTIG